MQALGNPLAAAPSRYALLAAQASQDDPDLLLGGILLRVLRLDAPDQLVAASFDVPDILFIFAP